MKQGTHYAARLKKAFAKARNNTAKPAIPEQDNPLHRLGMAVLAGRVGEKAAESAVQRLFATMVDWNEVRVSSVGEIQEALGHSVPDGLALAQRIKEVLQAVFQRENRLSLDRLRPMGRREAKLYLEGLAGIDAYAVASVTLWSLGGHAIPVDNKLLQILRDGELVHPQASREEVQAFLERNISAADAKEFCIAMRSFSPGAGGNSGRRTAPASSKKKKAGPG